MEPLMPSTNTGIPVVAGEGGHAVPPPGGCFEAAAGRAGLTAPAGCFDTRPPRPLVAADSRRRQGPARHADPIEAMARDMIACAASDGGVEEHHLIAAGWTPAEIIEYGPFAVARAIARRAEAEAKKAALADVTVVVALGLSILSVWATIIANGPASAALLRGAL
jgi:hypothetical protein